jgi:hypothetical protein
MEIDRFSDFFSAVQAKALRDYAVTIPATGEAEKGKLPDPGDCCWSSAGRRTGKSRVDGILRHGPVKVECTPERIACKTAAARTSLDGETFPQSGFPARTGSGRGFRVQESTDGWNHC